MEKNLSTNNPLKQACIWDAQLHEERASYYERIGDVMKAIQDIRPTVKLIPDNTNGYLKLSTMLYSIGEVEDSLKLVGREVVIRGLSWLREMWGKGLEYVN